MHILEDLKAMERDQIIDIANSMGIKTSDDADSEDIIYKILDLQAINASVTLNKRKPRGRKSKEVKAAELAVRQAEEMHRQRNTRGKQGALLSPNSPKDKPLRALKPLHRAKMNSSLPQMHPHNHSHNNVNKGKKAKNAGDASQKTSSRSRTIPNLKTKSKKVIISL